MTKTVARPLDQAVEALRSISKQAPHYAVILGSGVSCLTDLADEQTHSYQDVFGISPGVAGHAGSLAIGRVAGKGTCVLRGRFHLYEGHDWETVTLPVRALAAWGVKELFVTNAAGGLNRKFRVGDLMVLTGYRDMLNSKHNQTGLLPALAGDPVARTNRATIKCIEVAAMLHEENPSYQPVQRGVYAALLGPSYETLAEVEMLRRLRADAVGMSTVPEILSCQGSGCDVAGISVITNVWSDEAIGGHEEVLQAAQEASRRLDQLLKAVISV